MKSGVARCSILVLSEDSGEGAHDTLATLAKKMFLFIDPACQSQHIRFEPPGHEGAKQALRGNLWKSEEPKDQPKRRDLIGYMATKLFEGPTSFVLFHIDGDRPWSERDTSENIQKFRTFIERDLLQFVEHRRKSLAEARNRAPAATAAPAHSPDIRQLLLAVPYYSIEAWLLQNTEKAKELCAKHPPCGGAHRELLDAWAAERASLDDVHKPKDKICFRDAHNRSLAGSGYPTAAVYDAQASFADTINGLLECPMLLEALKATHLP